MNRKSASAAMERAKPEKIQTALPIPAIGANLSQPKLTRHKSEVRIRERFDGNLVPDSVKNMGQDGVLRFLKAKVQILAEQLENVQKDEKKLVEKVKGEIRFGGSGFLFLILCRTSIGAGAGF